MRRRKKMLKKMLSAVLAAAIVLTSGAFQASTVKAEGARASAQAQVSVGGSVWELYGNYIVRNETLKISFILQNDGTARVSQADTDITECTVPASIPFTYAKYDSYISDMNSAPVTPSPEDYFNDSNKSTVTIILNGAFKQCTSLETVKIEEGVLKIGKEAFTGCTALQSLYVPDSVVSMGYDIDETSTGSTIIYDIFDSGSSSTIYCSKGSFAETYAQLRNYKVSYTEPEVKTVTIAGKKWMINTDYTVIDEQGVKYQLNEHDTTAKVTCYGKSSATSAVNTCTVPKSVPLTYAVCKDILEGKNLDLSSADSSLLASATVAEIEERVFQGSDLEKVIIEADGVKKIGDGAFADCAALKAVQIPNTVSDIGSGILDGSSDCTVYCWKSSVADAYAQKLGYKIQYMDEAATESPSTAPTEPADTAAPSVSPSATAAPAATQRPYSPPVAPAATARPVPVTPSPAATQTPSATPNNTVTPAVTDAPNNTEIPSATDAPDQTVPPSATAEPTDEPDQQKVVEKKSVAYQLDEKDKTASIKKVEEKIKIRVTVPSTVKVNGVKYSVVKIEAKAFAGNKKLQSVTIGKNVTDIGTGAFKGCTKLKVVKFPSNLSVLGKNSFEGCENLKAVTISSSSLKKIGESAFKGCKKLKKVVIGKKVKKGTLAASGQKIRYGAGSVKLDISASAFENCVSLKQMVINSLVRRIGNSALKNCRSLRSLIVNSKILKEVAKRALKGVSNCKISVPGIKLKPYSVLFKNKGQGKKVIVAKI